MRWILAIALCLLASEAFGQQCQYPGRCHTHGVARTFTYSAPVTYTYRTAPVTYTYSTPVTYSAPVTYYSTPVYSTPVTYYSAPVTYYRSGGHSSYRSRTVTYGPIRRLFNGGIRSTHSCAGGS